MTEILNKIVGFMKDQTASKAEAPASSKWVYWLVIGIAAVISIAIAYYLMWKKGREIAKLQHEKDVNDELKRQEEENKKITSSTSEISVANAKIQELTKKNSDIDSQLLEIENQKKIVERQLENAKNWQDLDKLFNHPPSDKP